MSFEYTSEQFADRYNIIRDMITVGKSPVRFPTAYILGGQPGAGKSRLQKQILTQNNNCVVVNADAFRSFHPHYDYIQSEFGDDSPKYTQSFINQVTEKLIDDLSENSFNIIIEGTLRTSQIPINTCQFLKGKGYSVELHVIAVKKEISYESTILRYEIAIAQGFVPRSTAKDHHDMVVNVLVENLSQIEASNVFNVIKIFSRTGDCIIDNRHGQSAWSTVKNILYGDWCSNELNEYITITKAVCELKFNRNAKDYAEYKSRTNQQIRKIEVKMRIIDGR